MNQTSFRHVVVMGVSGSGKTTVGEALSPLVGLEYRDGDDMHPQANICLLYTSPSPRDRG